MNDDTDDDIDDADDDTPDNEASGGSARYAMSRPDLLEHCLRIAREYRTQHGMTLTLRQMYYQLVARGLVGSGQKIYKRIGDVLTQARYNGTFPINWLEDRGREVHFGQFTRTTYTASAAENDAERIRQAIPSFLVQRARWHGQNTYVSVWIEKQALEGVFDTICNELGVTLFACKGYPSASALYEWLKHAYFTIHGEHPQAQHALKEDRGYTFGHGFDWREAHEGTCSRAVVLYFGDHDPDGWEIPRSALRNLKQLGETYGLDVPLEFKRIALNMPQIRQYRPPPFEAKMTSARYAGYVREHHTTDAWELDALDPVVLRDLVRANVNAYFDEGTHRSNEVAIRRMRAELTESIRLRAIDEQDGADDGEDPDGEE